MVNCCVNPACSEEFRLLNAGNLYAHERRSSSTEFFWLCSTCASRFDVYLDAAGSVKVRERSAGHGAQPPNADAHLRLVSRSAKPTPRPHTLPSEERGTSFAFGAGPYLPAFGGSVGRRAARHHFR
jgi:hypothetical protein